MRVLVCGGRDYTDSDRIWSELDRVMREAPHDALTIIEGGARGTDQIAVAWCLDRSVPYDHFPANWAQEGKAAGPIRNQRMLEKGRPDLVLAFPGGRGTADMVRRATAAGVPVKEVR